MNPGKLRHRITIQKETDTQNSYGEPTKKWVDVFTVWASISPIAGKEYYEAETVNSSVTHKIRIRYRKGITPNMRIKYRDRYFNIISPPIDFQERHIELLIMTKEVFKCQSLV